jgi:hypothetical protein
MYITINKLNGGGVGGGGVVVIVLTKLLVFGQISLVSVISLYRFFFFNFLVVISTVCNIRIKCLTCLAVFFCIINDGSQIGSYTISWINYCIKLFYIFIIDNSSSLYCVLLLIPLSYIFVHHVSLMYEILFCILSSTSIVDLIIDQESLYIIVLCSNYVLTMVVMNFSIFWNIAPCSL